MYIHDGDKSYATRIIPFLFGYLRVVVRTYINKYMPIISSQFVSPSFKIRVISKNEITFYVAGHDSAPD